MSISFLKPSVIVLAGLLGIGFLPVANAKVVWVDIKGTGEYYCPDVCKITKRFHSKHPQYNVPYAVPSGLHTHPKVNKLYYVCSGDPARKGSAIGFNIDVKGISYECYVAFLFKTGPKLIPLSYYHCLCSDEPVEPIKER